MKTHIHANSNSIMSFARAAEGQNKVADDVQQIFGSKCLYPLHRQYTLLVETGGGYMGWKVDRGTEIEFLAFQ